MQERNYVTRFGSVFREDLKNPRKSYFAMTFEQGRELGDEEREKVLGMVKEVYDKTTGNREFLDQFSARTEAIDPALAKDDQGEDADAVLQDIPF